MSDLASTLRIEADASGVETGVASAKRSLSTLGAAAAQAGKAGGDGLAGIGAGAEASSKKVESATKNTIASIQRQIAAFEAGGTSSRQYQESLAKLRGIDTNALKPYLDQLDAARLKAQQAGRANEQLGQSFSGLGSMAGSASSMLASLGVSLSVAGAAAFVKRITNGVDALNDLKDATGASIENISALEDVALRTGASFDTVSTSLIKLNQALNTAKAGSDAELAIKAIGLSVQELKALDPAEAFRQVAIALSRFADDGNKARLTQELFGKSLKEVAPLLKDLAEKGQLNATVTTEQAEAAERLNKELFSLKKTATDLARTLVDSLTPAITQVLKDFRTFNEKASLAGLASEVIAADKAFRALQARKGGLFNFAGDLDAELSKAEDRLKKAKAAFNALDINNPANESAAEVARLARRPSVGDLPDTAAAKAAAAAAKKALEEQNKELAEQAKLLAELSGLSGSFSEDWARLNRIYAAGKLTTEQLVQAQADLLAKQPAMKAGAEAAAKAMREQEKAAEDLARTMAEYVKANEAGVASAVQAAVAAEADLANYGLLKSAVQEITLAHLEQSRELAALAGEDVSNIERRIDAQRRLIAATRGLEIIEANKKAAQEAEKDWLEMWRSVDQTAHDVFVNVFTDGSSAFKKLGQTLKAAVIDLLYQLTLKKWIISIGASLTGTAANAATGSGSSVLSGASNLAGLFGGFGGSAAIAGNAALASTIGITAGEAAAAAAAAGVAGGASAATAGIAASLGSTFAPLIAAAPYLAALAGVYMLAKNLDHSGTPHTGGGSFYSASGGLQTTSAGQNNFYGGFGGVAQSANTISMTSGLVQSVVGILDSTAVTFGKAAGYQAAASFADDSSKDGAWGTLFIKNMAGVITDWQAGQTGGWQPPRTFSDGEAGSAEYLAAISADVRAALDQIGLPAWAAQTLDALGASPSLEQLASAVAEINKTQSALIGIGKVLTGFSTLSDGAVQALLKASGGIDSLAAAASTYYDNFYSQAEKTANTTASVADALAAVGLQMPATRDDFRALVESQQALGEAGAPALAALLQVSGAFASVVPASEAAADAVGQMADAITVDIQALYAATVDAAAAARSALQELSDYGDTLRQNVADAQAGVDSLRAQAQAAVQAAQTAYSGALQAAQQYYDGLLTQQGSISAAINTLRGQAQTAVREAEAAYAGAIQAARDYYAGLITQQAQISASINTLRGQAAAAITAAAQGVDSARATLQASLQGVASAIQQAADAVTQAQASVGSARAGITSGYLAALEREAALKGDITAAYLAAQGEQAAAQQRLDDLQAQSAADLANAAADAARQMAAAGDAFRSAAAGIADTLREITGTALGSASVAQQYNAQKAAFERLVAQALAGDAAAAGKVGAAGTSLLQSSRASAGSYSAFAADDARVRQALLAVMAAAPAASGTASAATDNSAAIIAAQAALREATDKAAAAQALAVASGASLTASNRDLAAELAAATIEVARWSSAVEVSGSSRSGEQADILGAYNTSLSALAAAQDSQARLTAATAGLDLSGAQASADAWTGAVTQAASAQTALGTATEALAAATQAGIDVQADLYAENTGLAAQYADLQAQLGTITADLARMGDAYAAVPVDEVAALFAQLAATQGALLAAQKDAAATQADLYQASATLVGQYASLQADLAQASGDLLVQYGAAADALSLANAALVGFQARTDSIDFSALRVLDPLGDLLTQYAQATAIMVQAQGDLSNAISDTTIQNFVRGQTDDFAGKKAIYDAARQYNITSDRLDKAMLWAPGTSLKWALDNGLPAFASGGMFGGGLRIVGERGPELEATGAARIWSAQDTRALLSNIGNSANEALVAEIKALRAEVAALRADQRTASAVLANANARTAKTLEKWDADGLPATTT
jgi:hypothetical protein